MNRSVGLHSVASIQIIIFADALLDGVPVPCSWSGSPLLHLPFPRETDPRPGGHLRRQSPDLAPPHLLRDGLLVLAELLGVGHQAGEVYPLDRS